MSRLTRVPTTANRLDRRLRFQTGGLLGSVPIYLATQLNVTTKNTVQSGECEKINRDAGGRAAQKRTLQNFCQY